MTQKEWNDFVLENPPTFGAFLQSWEWGEFQKSIGRRVERMFEKENVGLLATAIQTELVAGQFYWFIPKGPLGGRKISERIGQIRANLADGAFLRMEPITEPGGIKIVERNPATTSVIDLTQTVEELYAGMKPKTRYNIRLSQKKGVVTEIVSLDRFDDFIRLMEQTTVRDNFHAHPTAYYKAMLEAMTDGEVKAYLAMAFYEGQPLAGNIMIDFGDTRTYLHGATSNLYRNVMAQYALHEFLILDAKAKGFKQFDFWGIAPEGAGEEHHWFGITRYKQGFGGDVVEMPGTYDIPTKQLWYAGYRFIQKIRGR